MSAEKGKRAGEYALLGMLTMIKQQSKNPKVRKVADTAMRARDDEVHSPLTHYGCAFLKSSLLLIRK